MNHEKARKSIPQKVFYSRSKKDINHQFKERKKKSPARIRKKGGDPGRRVSTGEKDAMDRQGEITGFIPKRNPGRASRRRGSKRGSPLKGNSVEGDSDQGRRSVTMASLQNERPLLKRGGRIPNFRSMTTAQKHAPAGILGKGPRREPQSTDNEKREKGNSYTSEESVQEGCFHAAQ